MSNNESIRQGNLIYNYENNFQKGTKTKKTRIMSQNWGEEIIIKQKLKLTIMKMIMKINFYLKPVIKIQFFEKN